MPLKKSYKPSPFLIIFALLFTFIWPANPGAAGPGRQPDHVILSWTGDPATTQTVAWRAESGTALDQIQYLPSEDYNGSFAGAQVATALESGLYTGYSRFTATLRGLASAKSYTYRAGREGAWSEPASFTTAGPEEEVAFLYMGDVQEGYDDWGKMLQSAFKDHPGLKFGLLGGDLVCDGASSAEWQQFFAAASPVFRYIPLMPAAGNHDDRPLFWDSFALPRNGPAGLEENFYSFDCGNCHIAVLNSNLMGASKSYYNEICNWLRQDLAGSGRQWKFLVFHHPPYPVAFDGHAGNLQENWAPLFEECGVDVVFVGHQHVYMRTKPLRGGQVQANPQDGIIYVTGNAGAKYYPAGSAEEYMYYIDKQVAGVSNYQVVNINGGVFTLTAKDAGGQVIDSFTLRKQALILPDVPVAAPSSQTPSPTIAGAGGQAIMTDPPPVIIKNRTSADTGDTGVPADTLTVKVGYFGGPYYTKKVYTTGDLEAMPQVKQAYSFIDSMPSVCLDSVVGVKLTDLLEDAGIDVNSVEVFYFYATDIKKGWYQSLPKSFLLDTERYYYPNLPTHWDYDAQMSVPGAVYGAVEVEPVIALRENWQRFATIPDFTGMSDETRFRLVFGQDDPDTCNASRSAKWVHAIEVMLGGSPPAGITLDQDIANLKVGSALQLTATVAPDDATDKSVIWSSSDTGVATVDEHGLVTVAGPGTAIITASAIVGGLTATCIVNGPNRDSGPDEAPAGAGFSDNGEPGDPTGPLPESGLRYLAEREAVAGQDLSGAFLEQAGSQPWRIYEMSPGAVPLQRQVQNSIEAYEVAIFLMLFLFGSVIKYREYAREVAR